MLSKHEEIHAALSQLPAEVSYFYPQDWDKLPAVTYYEMANTPDSMADDDEYSTELNYVVDVWSVSPSEMVSLAMQVDEALSGIGLIRTFTLELYESETKISHKTMRFRGVF